MVKFTLITDNFITNIYFRLYYKIYFLEEDRSEGSVEMEQDDDAETEETEKILIIDPDSEVCI